VKKRKHSSNDISKWMRDRDLARTLIFLICLIAGLYLISFDILLQVNPKGFVYLLYQFMYIFSIYQRASPGEQLSADISTHRRAWRVVSQTMDWNTRVER
jgi:hypothetical protein